MANSRSTQTSDTADSVLLDRYVQTDDHEAFRLLVERHGPLVLSVCRRSLCTATDAEDAFQATFLVLTQSAHKIRSGESLAAWLYGVAASVSGRMRRRKPKEIQAMQQPAVEQDPLYELLARHDARVVDEELTALPANLRTPLVLRYLVGKSNAEVAKELGITVAALEGRLKRGKRKLRVRLLQRGIVFTALVSTLQATQVTASELPASLVAKTLDVRATGGGSLAGSSATTNPIVQLAQEEITAMKTFVLTKSSAAVVAISSVAVLAAAVQMAVAEGSASPASQRPTLEATAGSESPAAQSQAAPAIVQVSQNGPAGQQASDRNDPFGAFAASPQAEDPFARTKAEPEAVSSFESAAEDSQQAEFPYRQFADSKQRSASERRIEVALVRQVGDLDFLETPLAEIVEFLRSEFDIQMMIDERALDELAISPDDPVSINVRGISLESALCLMLRSLELTHIVKDEVLLITTADEAEATFETRVYPYPKTTLKPEMLQQVIAPDTWQANGGEGDVVVVGDQLIVRQTYAVHGEINALLLQMR